MSNREPSTGAIALGAALLILAALAWLLVFAKASRAEPIVFRFAEGTDVETITGIHVLQAGTLEYETLAWQVYPDGRVVAEFEEIRLPARLRVKACNPQGCSAWGNEILYPGRLACIFDTDGDGVMGLSDMGAAMDALLESVQAVEVCGYPPPPVDTGPRCRP